MSKKTPIYYSTLMTPTEFSSRDEWADIYLDIMSNEHPMRLTVQGEGGATPYLNELIALIELKKPTLALYVVGDCLSCHAELVTYLIKYIGKNVKQPEIIIDLNAVFLFHRTKISKELFSGTSSIPENIMLYEALLKADNQRQYRYVERILYPHEIEDMQGRDEPIILTGRDMMARTRDLGIPVKELL